MARPHWADGDSERSTNWRRRDEIGLSTPFINFQVLPTDSTPKLEWRSLAMVRFTAQPFMVGRARQRACRGPQRHVGPPSTFSHQQRFALVLSVRGSKPKYICSTQPPSFSSPTLANWSSIAPGTCTEQRSKAALKPLMAACTNFLPP